MPDSPSLDRRSEQITAASLKDAEDRLHRALEAIECEAYRSASELASEAAQVLDAMVNRMVTERIEAGQ